MQQYEVVLFDLDGTLTDPREGITKSIQYGLEKIGIIETDLSRLEPFIGPPLIDSFKTFYHLDEARALEAIHYYRERFGDVGLFENELFEAIPNLLAQLKKHYHLVVATSKPTIFATQIVEHFEIDRYFDHVIGSHLDGSRVDKVEIIGHIQTLYPDIPAEKMMMIGDRKFDLIGANHYGMDSIAVRYGFAALEELQAHNPTHIVDSVKAIGEILL